MTVHANDIITSLMYMYYYTHERYHFYHSGIAIVIATFIHHVLVALGPTPQLNKPITGGTKICNIQPNLLTDTLYK